MSDDVNDWLGSEDGFCSKKLLLVVTESRAECIIRVPRQCCVLLLRYGGVFRY